MMDWAEGVESTEELVIRAKRAVIHPLAYISVYEMLAEIVKYVGEGVVRAAIDDIVAMEYFTTHNHNLSIHTFSDTIDVLKGEK